MSGALDGGDLLDWLAGRRARLAWRRERARWLVERANFPDMQTATDFAEDELGRMSLSARREVVRAYREAMVARIASAEARLARVGIRA